MPSVYKLGLLPGASGIRLSMSEEAIAFLKKNYNTGISYASLLQKDFGFNTTLLVPFGGDRFGYHGVLEFCPEEEFSVKASFHQEQPISYLSASLFLLFKCLNFTLPDLEFTHEPIWTELNFRRGVGGYELRAVYSADLLRWVHQRYGHENATQIPEIYQAMLAAGRTLHSNKSRGWEGFLRAEIVGQGGFYLVCDSNCCCMGGRAELGKCFRAATCNSDWSVSQLIFLIGVAAISEEYLKSLGN